MEMTQRRKKQFTIGIYAMMFTSAICTSAQGVLLSDFINYYKLESSAQGMISAAQSAGQILSIFLIGMLVGKMQKSSVLILAAIAIPCVCFILGMKPSFIIMLLLFLTYGIAFGFLDSLTSSLMVDLYQEKSAKYMNLLHGIYGIGGLTGPIVIQQLHLSGMKWYSILVVCGGCATISSIVYISSALSYGKSRKSQADKPNAVCLSDIKGYFLEKRKRILLGCAFLYGAHQIGLTVWITRYISDYLHTPAWGALALSCFWAGITASRLLISRFEVNRAKLVFWCHVITAIIVSGGVLIGNGFVMMICGGLAGFAEGVILPMTLDIACGWEREKTFLGSTMLLFTHYIGFVISAPAIAFVITRIGIQTGMLLPALFSAGAACCAYFLIRYDVQQPSPV